MGFDGFTQILLGSLMQAAILALATFGIVLIFKTSFTTNFAQGSIAAFSAYVMFAVINMLFERGPGLTTPWYFYLIGMAVAIIAAFLIGLFVDTMIIRKAKFITSAGKQMITMGLVLILTALTDIIFGVYPKTVDRISYQTFETGGNFNVTMTGQELFGVIIAFTVLILVFMALRFTKWGLGVRATASNEIVSSMMGINTRFITAMSWAVAGGLGALAAALYAPSTAYLSSAMMVSFQVNGFLALILGGAATFHGPIIAAIIIPIANGFVSYYLPEWANVIIYVLILFAILIKPNGLFGKKVQKKV
ncbi:MAG: branched-chain amino acid ABC transporter permease [Acholeplasmataceae bacterium]|jgi:branched-chain amino acid transport system permease protein